MPNSTEPLIRLEPGGKAPIVTYRLPEPSIYFGGDFIEPDYDVDFLTDKAKKAPIVPARTGDDRRACFSGGVPSPRR